jgi:hypothetical protein
MVNRLSPLAEDNPSGKDLLALFIENGAELSGVFDLDTDKLERILSTGTGNHARRIGRRDLELLAMSGNTDPYRNMLIRETIGPAGDPEEITSMLRKYLYTKYLDESKTPPDTPPYAKKPDTGE